MNRVELVSHVAAKTSTTKADAERMVGAVSSAIADELALGGPCIVATHSQRRGRCIELVGKRVKEVARRLKRDVLDVEVEVAFKRRAYAGIRHTPRRRPRLVAVRLHESSDYRFYLTNIASDSLDAHLVDQTYATRWQIELTFKALKSHYRLEELPTRKAHIVETLLLGAVLPMLVSRRLLLAMQERLRRTSYKIPEQRWAANFAPAAPATIDIVVLPPRVSKVIARRPAAMLLNESPDPNRSWQLLIERVESGVAWGLIDLLQRVNRSPMRPKGTDPLQVSGKPAHPGGLPCNRSAMKFKMVVRIGATRCPHNPASVQDR